MSAGGARIRPATVADFERIYPLLQQLNDTRISREIWRRLFLPLWREDDFCPGYVIEDGERIGGFIGTLYSERRINGELRRLCNLTSWVVLPEYRQQSVMMLMPLLRDKSVTLTSLTSSHEAYAVYNKLGFVDLEASARVIYRFPSLLQSRYRLYRGEQLVELLDTACAVVYRDHAGLDLQHCVVERDGDRCYLVLEIKRERAHLHYVSEPGWFRAHLSGFRYRLLVTLGVRTLQVDERILQQRHIFLSRRKVLKQPKQYRSQQLDAADIDALYSELTVLAAPPETDAKR